MSLRTLRELAQAINRGEIDIHIMREAWSLLLHWDGQEYVKSRKIQEWLKPGIVEISDPSLALVHFLTCDTPTDILNAVNQVFDSRKEKEVAMIVQAHGTLVVKSVHPSIPLPSDLMDLYIECEGTNFYLATGVPMEPVIGHMPIKELLPVLKTFANVAKWGLTFSGKPLAVTFDGQDEFHITSDQELKALIDQDI